MPHTFHADKVSFTSAVRNGHIGLEQIRSAQRRVFTVEDLTMKTSVETARLILDPYAHIGDVAEAFSSPAVKPGFIASVLANSFVPPRLCAKVLSSDKLDKGKALDVLMSEHLPTHKRAAILNFPFVSFANSEKLFDFTQTEEEVQMLTDTFSDNALSIERAARMIGDRSGAIEVKMRVASGMPSEKMEKMMALDSMPSSAAAYMLSNDLMAEELTEQIFLSHFISNTRKARIMSQMALPAAAAICANTRISTEVIAKIWATHDMPPAINYLSINNIGIVNIVRSMMEENMQYADRLAQIFGLPIISDVKTGRVFGVPRLDPDIPSAIMCSRYFGPQKAARVLEEPYITKDRLPKIIEYVMKKRPDKAVHILNEHCIPSEEAAELLMQYEPEEVARLLSDMESVRATRILVEFPPDFRARVISEFRV